MTTEIITVHRFRRTARRKERALQGGLDAMRDLGVSTPAVDGYFTLPLWGAPQDRLPGWTCNVRVRRAGAFHWVVEATG